MTGRTVSRADAKVIAETAADLADKVLHWKDRALRAEEAERKFASEIYARTAVTPTAGIPDTTQDGRA